MHPDAFIIDCDEKVGVGKALIDLGRDWRRMHDAEVILEGLRECARSGEGAEIVLTRADAQYCIVPPKPALHEGFHRHALLVRVAGGVGGCADLIAATAEWPDWDELVARSLLRLGLIEPDISA